MSEWNEAIEAAEKLAYQRSLAERRKAKGYSDEGDEASATSCMVSSLEALEIAIALKALRRAEPLPQHHTKNEQA